MTRITSLQNPRVKAAMRLRDGRHRAKQGRILIDGARELRRAVEAGARVEEVFVCPPLCESRRAVELVELLPRAGAEVLEVTEAILERLSFGRRCEGLIGVAEMPQARLEAIELPGRPLVAVLEGVEKPGNVGAVLRSADGAGVSALVVADPRTDLYNPNTIRASLGTVFTMPVAAAATEAAMAWLRAHRLAVYAARVDADLEYAEVDWTQRSAVVLGSEARGLSPAWSGDGVVPVRLPMRGVADSLNVSAAAAVLFYEARRQRARA